MTPEEHLNFLLRFLKELYRIVEQAVHETQTRFEDQDEPVEVFY